ncbi:MAG TPA: Ig-like domain-containing protein [Longimicrobium sp.]|jgi:hypothetical protein
MTLRRRLLATVFFAALAACSGDSPTAPRPARLEKVGGDGQTGAPAGALLDSLAVRVVSAGGRAVPGVTVTWSVAEGGGALGAPAAVTDSAGVAKAGWTLGAPGRNAATASVAGVPPATFTATAVPVASVTVSPAAPSLGKGDALQLAAVPRDSAGNPLAGRPVRWSSSDPGTAAVSEAGVVTGVALGTATITAASEERSGSVVVTVTAEDRAAPRLTGLSLAPAAVDVTSAAASVEVLVSAADGGTGVESIFVIFQGSAPGTGTGCSDSPSGTAVLVGGSPASGVWRCTAAVPRGAVPGTWTINDVILIDRAGNQGHSGTADLRAAGLPFSFSVANTAPPARPALTAVAITPDAVDVSTSAASVEVVLSANAGAGVREVNAALAATRGEPPGGQSAGCSALAPASGTQTAGTWRCTLSIPRSAAAGTWNLWVTIRDQAGNSVLYDPPALAAAGLPGTLRVVSASEDVTAPVLTSLSVSPTRVSLGDLGSTVEFSFTAADAGTGVRVGGANLRQPDNQGGRGCSADPAGGAPQQSAVFRCSILLPPSSVEGTWTVQMVFFDALGNSRAYTAAELRAAGFPAEVVVTR